MLGYARAYFNLHLPGQDGSTLAQHLHQVRRSTGVIPDELSIGSPPVHMEHLWHVFLDIRRSVPSDQSVGYEVLDAFQRIEGIGLEPTEAKVLMALDVEWRNARAEKLREAMRGATNG